jgi:hypothetical protein
MAKNKLCRSVRCYKQVVATQKDEYEKQILIERATSF